MKLKKNLGKLLAVGVIGGVTLGGCGGSSHNVKTPTVSNPITQTNKSTDESTSTSPSPTESKDSKTSTPTVHTSSNSIKKIDESAKAVADKIAKEEKIKAAKEEKIKAVQKEKAESDKKNKETAKKIKLKSVDNNEGGGLKTTNNVKTSGGAKYYTSAPVSGSKYKEVAKNTPISARPVSITISSIGVNNATVIARGLTGGVLAPPPGYVQWYTGSVKPGNNGISVLAGHVTYYGADVLYNLGRTPIGARITVHFSNGVSKSFTVKRRGTVNKNTLRYDQTVWGASSTPKLVIISCDKYSAWAGLHHVNNYIVWAE